MHRTVDQRRWFMVALGLFAWVVAGFAIDASRGTWSAIMAVLWVVVGALALVSVGRPSLTGVALIAMMPLATIMCGWSLVGGIDWLVSAGARGNPIGIREACFYLVDIIIIFATVRLPPVITVPDVPVVAGDDGGE